MKSRFSVTTSRLASLAFGIVLLVGVSVARPASYSDYLGVHGDVASVESLRREVRQPAPEGFAREAADLLVAGNKPAKANKKKAIKNESGKSDEGGYYRTYGSDADGEKGYERQTYSKGDHGYKTLGTFHKQNGDNYGFEKHTAFGHARGGEEGGQSGKSGSHKSSAGDHEGAGTHVDSYYAEDEGDHSSYTDGGDSYGDDGESAHYSSGGDGDGSYEHSEGYSENYSSDGDDDGSYDGSHSSYTAGGDDDGDYY